MLGSSILDVALGLTFVFLLFSLILTAARELIESVFKTRSADLERGIRELLADPSGDGLAKRFYEHPLIFSLFRGSYEPAAFGALTGARKGAKNLPAYIPARNFAAALLDLVGVAGITPPKTAAEYAAAAANLPNEGVRTAVLTAAHLAGGDLDAMRRELEAWYDSTMDRVSGWYKQRTQVLVFWLALALSVGANVNSLGIGAALAQNAALRQAIVSDIERTPPPPDMTPEALNARYASLQELGLPIGWSAQARGYVEERLACPGRGRDCAVRVAGGGLEVLLGWLITALAITLGAPFWFDVLNKIMVIRSTVKPREKSPEEGSEDRRPAKARKGPERVQRALMQAE